MRGNYSGGGCSEETGTKTIRVLICDDHALMRAGIKELLAVPEVEVVGEAATAEGAVELASALRPDVLLVDISMPVMGGIAAARLVREKLPSAAVLILTMEDSVDAVRSAFEAGAAGFILKDATVEELLSAVETVAGGGRYVHPRMGAAMAAVLASPGESTPIRGPGGALSPREVEVLRELALGRTNAEVADKLYLSVRTVENHRAHIFAKLDVHSRAELVSKAIEAGLMAG